MTDLHLLDDIEEWDEADEWADEHGTRRFRITIEGTVSALRDSARYGSRLERASTEGTDEDDPLLLETAIVDGILWVDKVTKVELLNIEDDEEDEYDYAPTPIVAGR